MRIAWIFPIQKKCGISIYSERYLKELSSQAEIETFDNEDVILNPKDIVDKVNQYDIVHIQYETSLYINNRKDIFKKFVKKIKIPIVVSLHEVYDEFPGVYPKRHIKGILSPIKKLIYDYRHPIVTAYNKHIEKSFYADKLLVHYNYQKDIIKSKISNTDSIIVLTYPTESKRQNPVINKNENFLSLISTGFINKNFNYNFLFSTLEKLSIPWKFSWLGGPRQFEDNYIIENLNKEIAKREWGKKFTITGWLSNAEMEDKINKADIALHLYKSRSSSDTLCKSISYGIPIIATKIPLTEELQKDSGIILTNQNDSTECSESIENLYINRQAQIDLSNKEYSYAKNHSYTLMAKELIKIYGDLLT